MILYQNKIISSSQEGDLSGILRNIKNEPDPIAWQDKRLVVGAYTIEFEPFAYNGQIRKQLNLLQEKGILLGAHEAVAMRDHLNRLEQIKKMEQGGLRTNAGEAFLPLVLPEGEITILFMGTVFRRFLSQEFCTYIKRDRITNQWHCGTTDYKNSREKHFCALATPKGNSYFYTFRDLFSA